MALLILAAGTTVRLFEYFSRSPLWADEARVALNVGKRSWLELSQVLDHDQTAPVPFLWAVRLAVELLGMNEFGLRLLPLLGGLALLPALWWLTRRGMGDRVALVATALAAASPLLVRYSTEVKQYSLDAVATVVALTLAVRLLETPTSSRAWNWLALGGAGLVVVSQPAPFVLAGCGLALLLSPDLRRTRDFPKLWLATVTIWIAVFALVYVTSYLLISRSGYMQAFWSGTYLDPTAPDFRERLKHAAQGVLAAVVPGTPAGVTARVLVLATFGGLAFLVVRRQAAAVALLAGPFLAAGLASSLGLYPIAPRLTLFLTPLAFLMLAVAVEGVARWVGRAAPAVVAVALLLCAAGAGTILRAAIQKNGDPWNARTLIEHYEHHGGTDPVYLYAAGIPAWTFYTTDWSAPDRARLERIASLVRADGPAFTNLPPRGRPVRCEGDSLVLSHGGRLELLGLGAGVRIVMPFRGWPQRADTGWAENEVRRMRATGRERVWLLGIYLQDPWLRELLDAVQAAGGRAETTFVARRDVLRRATLTPLRFDLAVPAPGCPAPGSGPESDPAGR